MSSKLSNSLLVIAIVMIVFLMASVEEIMAQSGKLENGKKNISDYENESKINQDIPKISAGLKQIINDSPDEIILVTITLKEQPLYDISQKNQEKYESELQDVKSKVKTIYKEARINALARKNSANKNASGEVKIKDEISTDIASALTEADKQSILEENSKFEKIKQEMVKDIIINTKEKIQPQQQKIKDKIIDLGGSIDGEGSFFNVVFARISADKITSLEEIAEIESVEKTGLYSNLLDTSTYSINSNTFWSNGYFGYPWAVAVADTGIDKTHPALSVSYEEVFHSEALVDNSTYNDDPNSTDDLQGHGTHVAGIIKSNDFTYRGVANGTILMNAKFGWKDTLGRGSGYWGDAMQAIDWAISSSKGDGAEVISFSFGGDPSPETSMSRYFDSFIDSLGVVGVIAAGNDGAYGPGTINDPAMSYNAITVGAMYDNDNANRADDTIASYSSRGPVPGTSRIKPDIMAPGSNIMSANNIWETQADFVSKNGTSMAAPHISGAAALIMSAGVSDPKEIKALLINTAEDKGAAGGDYDYGWGYVDLGHTFFHTSDVRSGIVNTTNRYKLYKGYAFSGDKASLVWNRHATYANTTEPITYYSLSNLDLYLYNESNGTLISSSNSSDENVEQVISNTNTNTVIKVHAYAFSSAISSEEFALASEEGFNTTSLPNLSLEISNPNIVGSSKNFNVSINVTNQGDVSIHDVNVTLSLPSGFTLISGSNYYNPGSIAAGSRKNATWTVNSHSIGGSYSLSASYNSLSYGETYTASNSSSILVDATPPVIIGNPTSYGYSFSAAKNNSRITVNATISDTISPIKNATVDGFSINGSLINPVVLSNVSGYWINESIVVNASDGIYLLNVTAYDNADNTRTSAQITVMVDNSPPIINNAQIYYQGGLTAAKNGTSITLNASISDILAGVKNATINVSQINKSLGIVILNNISGIYTNSSVIVNASDGIHLLNITACDNAGNKNDTVQIPVNVDNTPPVLNITRPHNIFYNTTSLSLNVTANETISTWLYSLNGTANVSFGSTGTTLANTTVTISTQGLNNITVYARDPAGNWNSSRVNFTVDTIGPVIMIDPQLNNNRYNTTNISLNVSANENVSTWLYKLNDAANASLNSSNATAANTTITASQGTNTLIVYANDTQNNWNVSNTVTFSVDSIAPAITISYPGNNTNISIFDRTISGNINDTNSFTANLTVGDQRINWTTVGNFSLRANYSSGINYINITVNDSYNNINISTTILNVTSTNLTDQKILNGTSVNISANASTGVDLVLTANESNWANVTASINASFNASYFNASNIANDLGRYVEINVTGDRDNLTRVQLTMFYNHSDLDKNGNEVITDVGDLKEDTLNMYWYWDNATTGIAVWWPLTDNTDLSGKIDKSNRSGPKVFGTVERNTTADYVRVTVNHFSLYSMAGTPIVASTQPCTSCGSGGGGGGGGGGGRSGENISNIEVIEKYDMQISKDVLTSYRFTHAKNPIMFVNITGNTSLGIITSSIEVLKDTSTLVNVSPEGHVYKNANIWVGTAGYATPKNIKKALIKFRIDNAWLSEKGVNSGDIVLVKWDGTGWINLETKVLSKDDTNTYFEGETNSFSPFAIKGTKGGTKINESQYVTADKPKPEQSPTPVIEQTKNNPGFGSILAISGLLGIYILRRRSKRA